MQATKSLKDQLLLRLQGLIDQLEPLQEVLDDNGLHSYADELFEAIQRVKSLASTVTNEVKEG
jgi:hypothetical protein